MIGNAVFMIGMPLWGFRIFGQEHNFPSGIAARCVMLVMCVGMSVIVFVQLREFTDSIR